MYNLKHDAERRKKIDNFYNELDSLTIKTNDINLNYRDYVYEDQYGLLYMTGEMKVIAAVYDKHMYGIIRE